MAKHPQVFQPKIIVHQSGLNALYTPSSPYSAFSPTKTKSYGSTRTSYSSLCRGSGGVGGISSTFNTQSTLQASNTFLNEFYYQAFRSGFPALLDQCHPFSERKSSTKRFVCNYHGCGKMFGRNEEKTRHEKIHSGVKPYACELCSKRFGRKDHLTQHMRTHNRSRREGEGRRDENDKNSRNQSNNNNKGAGNKNVRL